MKTRYRGRRWWLVLLATLLLAGIAVPAAANTPDHSGGPSTIGNYGFTSTDAEEEGYWYSGSAG